MRIFSWWMTAFLLAAAAAGAGELSGRRAPGFSLPDSKMRQHDLQDYRGKVLLIDVMKTDCPHCVFLTRALEAAQAKYGSRIAVLSVVNPPDNVSSVQAYVSQNKVTSPVVFDCGQMAASYLKVTPERPSVSVPHLFVIDAAGQIADDFAYGPQTRNIFEGQGLFPILDRLLNPAPARK
ncbi:MAG: TlpA family protein disulfide reductase [Acidobacteria bacterium]|nr:TlpA family protein disulfide reductase [Acidobacteriota bacterium]